MTARYLSGLRGEVDGHLELRQGNQATDDEPSFRESGAARPPLEGGRGAERKGGEGRSGAEARTDPTSPIRVRFGARAHWGVRLMAKRTACTASNWRFSAPELPG